MSIQGEQLNVTELDFQSIKSNLIDYFKGDGNNFTDWDFEGSNLNTILDLLAYNTHYNALLAHMAVNESFIDSARLRPNVVAAAKLLSYTPRSFTSSKALLSVRIPANLSGPSSAKPTITLPKGTIFTTSFEGKRYTYVVMNDSPQLDLDGGFYVSQEPFEVYEGRLKTLRLEANASDVDTLYTIPDANVDINPDRFTVRVYPTQNLTNDTSAVYQRYPYPTINIDGNSNNYFIQENTFGLYEIQFGNGTYGRKLESGNVIEIEYLVTSGSEPNGANTSFSLSSAIDGTLGNGVVTLEERINSGTDKENISELKRNSTSNFITQNRGVTADDYKSIILTRFSDIGSVSVWGGEDNDPPQYGSVFISLKPASDDPGAVVSNAEKTSILNYLSGKKMLSILPEIVDPSFIYINLDVLFKYDSNLLGISSNDLEEELRINILEAWNETNLDSFDSIFRHSSFVRSIDNYSRSILNSHVRVFVEQKYTLYPQNSPNVQTGDFILDFGVTLIDDDNEALMAYETSAIWTHNGLRVYIGQEKSSTEHFYTLYSYNLVDGQTQKRLRDIGSVDLRNGKITLFNNIYSDDIFGNGNPIEFIFTMKPKSNDLIGKRNKLLVIDSNRCRISGDPDEIAAGGGSQTIRYTAFDRDRRN